MTSFVIKQGIYLCVARHAIRSLMRSDKIYSFIINPSVDHLISGWQSCFQIELSAAVRYWCVHITTTLRDDRSLKFVFSENFRGGGGSFSIQKIMLQLHSNRTKLVVDFSTS